MIPTNQFEMIFDHCAIAKRFVILEASRDDGDYRRSLVPDLALQVGRALSVAYARGNCCYILYERKSADPSPLKTALEKEDGNVRLQEISSEDLARKRAFLLAQLLCNAIPALSSAGQMYHNLTGKLYHLDRAWHRGRGEVPRCFWALRIEFTWDGCIKLPVVTFSAAERKQRDPSAPQYLFDSKSYTLRRLVRQDPDRNTPRFVIGSPDTTRKNTVPFLEFGSLEDFQHCKVGVLQNFLDNVTGLLAPYLVLRTCYLQEEAHLGNKAIHSQMENIRRRLREAPVYMEDTVQDERSAALAVLLRKKLLEYSGITLCEGIPTPGATLFRVIHNKEFYQDHPDQDPYRHAPSNYAVQHLTIEDFQLCDLDISEKEDAALRKVLQELAIKRDILHETITCYDWASAGYTSPVNFVIITDEGKQKDGPLCYRRLRVLPDGALEYAQWKEELFWQDTEREKIAAAFQKDNGKVDFTVEGLIYQDADDIHVIRKTEQYTLPDVVRLQTLLASTRDGEWLDIEPLVAVVRDLIHDAPEEDRLALEIICADLSALTPQAPRKQIRTCLKLRTALGRWVNDEIFARTGTLIGSGIKQKEKLNQIFGGTLDIRLFTQNKAQYYYSGTPGPSLQWSLARACCIRKVTSTGGRPHFANYLPLMEVDFVRTSAWTVLPFPFKYLREWKAE